MKPARHLAAIAALLAIFPFAQGLRAEDEITPAEKAAIRAAVKEADSPPAEEKQVAGLLKEGDSIKPPEGPVRSALGYEAVIAPLSPDEEDSEGSFTTIILKGNQVVARVENARPVMFSPKGDILLLMDAAPDDDCRHFLLNVAGGEKAPKFNERHRIGTRHSDSPRWSKDGKVIQFANLSGDPFGNAAAETIVVAEHLGKNRQPEKSVKGVELKVLHAQLELSTKEVAVTEEALSQATTPEEKAAAQLDLEKYKLWKQELEKRISQSESSK